MLAFRREYLSKIHFTYPALQFTTTTIEIENRRHKCKIPPISALNNSNHAPYKNQI